MVRIPSDIKASLIISRLEKHYGFIFYSQKGSHIKLKRDGSQPLTIPNHKPIKTGTMRSILNQVSEYTGESLETILITLKI